MKMISVSVVMAVCNGESFVRQTIDSIVDQSFQDFEFIIIDDGSTDNTYKILEEYQKSDTRIMLLRNSQNIKLAKSLNKAISCACGEYIARIDAGSIALPDRLLKQAQYMELHPDIGLLGTGCRFVYSIGTRQLASDLMNPTEHCIILKKMRKQNPFFHPSVMFKRSLFAKLDGYDESFETSQDHELWTRMICESRVANLPDTLVIKTFYTYSTSIKKNNKQLKANLRILSRKIRMGISPWYYSVYFSKYILELLIPNSLRGGLRIAYNVVRGQ